MNTKELESFGAYKSLCHKLIIEYTNNFRKLVTFVRFQTTEETMYFDDFPQYMVTIDVITDDSQKKCLVCQTGGNLDDVYENLALDLMKGGLGASYKLFAEEVKKDDKLSSFRGHVPVTTQEVFEKGFWKL